MNPDTLELSSDEAKRLEDLIEGLGEGAQTSNTPPQGATASNITPENRLKSPLKMRYSAEVEIIRKKWGHLEDIRQRLGLSQRKISQLLMVDPSAWTRWTKYDHEAPPHIYRALSWFLLLQEKDANQTPYSYLQSIARPTLPKAEVRMIGEELHTSLTERLLKENHLKTSTYFASIKWLLLLNAVLLGALLSAVLWSIL